MSKRTFDLHKSNELRIKKLSNKLMVAETDIINYALEYALTPQDTDSFEQFIVSKLETQILSDENTLDEDTDLFRGINGAGSKTFDDVLGDIDSLGDSQ